MEAKRARSGDLPLLPATSSPGESISVVHRLSSPPSLSFRMDWSNLEDGPAGMITERLLANDVADYVRFRAVCRPWRQCSADPRAHGVLDRRFHPRRWIMLREKFADSDPDLRRLLNLSTGQCVQAHLPDLRGHDVCSPTVEGLLVLLNRRTYAVRLLNPLTGQVADLPPATTLYPLDRRAMYNFDPRLDFEVSGAGFVDDATVAVLLEEIQMIAVAKPGDEKWTLIKQSILLKPAISFAGRFYCTYGSDIMMVVTRGNQPPQLVVAAKINHQYSGTASTVHLLDNDGELMFLSRALRNRIGGVEDRFGEEEDFPAGARNFMEYKVSRVNLDAGKTQPISDLGGRAVFIGSSRAISVSPLTFPTIRNDSVYLGKDHNLESTGPHKLVDGTGTTMSFGEGSGITEACGFNNQYGPHSIVDYLSQYVTKGA